MLMPPPPGGPNPTSRRRDSPIFEQFDGLPGEIEDAGYMIDNGGPNALASSRIYLNPTNFPGQRSVTATGASKFLQQQKTSRPRSPAQSVSRLNTSFVGTEKEKWGMGLREL